MECVQEHEISKTMIQNNYHKFRNVCVHLLLQLLDNGQKCEISYFKI